MLEARKGSKNGTTDGNSKKSNGTTSGKNTVDKACAKMAKLTALTNLAANQTKLDAQLAKGKLNQTEIDDLKAKAANATTTLQTMQANTTLVSECAVVDAHQKVLGQCKQIKSLQKLSDLANNQTAMDALTQKKQLNDTQVAKLDERIANATAKLKEMQTNTTLTDLCASQQQGKANSGGGKFTRLARYNDMRVIKLQDQLRPLALAAQEVLRPRELQPLLRVSPTAPSLSLSLSLLSSLSSCNVVEPAFLPCSASQHDNLPRQAIRKAALILRIANR